MNLWSVVYPLSLPIYQDSIGLGLWWLGMARCKQLSIYISGMDPDKIKALYPNTHELQPLMGIGCEGRAVGKPGNNSAEPTHGSS